MTNNQKLIYRELEVCPAARLLLLKRTESVYAYYLNEEISHYARCTEVLNTLSAMPDELFDYNGYDMATFNPSI